MRQDEEENCGVYTSSVCDKSDWCGRARAQAREVRQGFVRKVLGLVLLQLLVTAGASFAFLYVDPLKARRPNPSSLLCMH